MAIRALDGLTIKAALLLGFGLTLGVWLLAGYDFTRRMSQVERDATAINARYTQAQELLSTVRPRVLLASVYVRDALLDPDPAAAGPYRRRLARTLENVDDALRQYVPVLHSAEERERVERLRREIEQFGDAMAQVLATDSRRPADEARALLARLAPRREVVIGVTEQVQALNRAAFIQQQASIAETYRVNQRRVWQRLGLSLAGSLGIALLAIFYVTRLERRLRKQGLRDARNTRDLQRLSAQVLHAQEEERRTIARELHDEVGQVLMALKVELALAARRIEASGGTRAVLDDLQSLTDGALHSVRDLSHLLHPALLDDLGLAAAIDWYLQGFGRRHGIGVELRHDMATRRLASDVETAAYRMVQEALTNVAKHANADSCRISLECADELRITIQDDGIGFDAEASAHAGLGLVGIRERIAQLGGRLSLESVPGKGTTLRAQLPAREREAAPAARVGDAAPLVGADITAEVLGG
ncbi:MAG: sensor histidine kinase [Vicinamibacterales bacterium]